MNCWFSKKPVTGRFFLEEDWPGPVGPIHSSEERRPQHQPPPSLSFPVLHLSSFLGRVRCSNHLDPRATKSSARRRLQRGRRRIYSLRRRLNCFLFINCHLREEASTADADIISSACRDFGSGNPFAPLLLVAYLFCPLAPRSSARD